MKVFRCLCLLSLCLASALPALAAYNTTFWGDLALKGYDPVAYFEQGEAVEGRKEFSYEWEGANWRFASQDHLDAFRSDPERYAPQYGGYCAWAVSQGKTADIDPEAWKVVDGKLYLNYNKSIQHRWEKDIPGFIRKADEEWPKLRED